MKKFISFLLALALSSSLVFGQDAQKASDGKTAAKKQEQSAKAEPSKTDAKASAPTKKDGTPDMRYKANKDAKKTAGPTKKDGTPDKRYKANKDAAPKK